MISLNWKDTNIDIVLVTSFEFCPNPAVDLGQEVHLFMVFVCMLVH